MPGQFVMRSTSLQQDVTNTPWEEEEEEDEEEKRKRAQLAEEEVVDPSIITAGLEPDPEEMEKAIKLQCLGGWGFLLLALGIFILVPGSVLASYYATKSGETLQIVSLTLVGVAVFFIFLGSAFTAYWCCEYKDVKKGDSDSDAQTLTPAHSMVEFRYPPDPYPEED